MTTLSSLADLGAEAIWAVALVFLRVGAALALLPAFGDQTVPARVRLILAFALTAVTAPAVWPSLPEDPGPVALPAEVLAGLLIGIGFRLFILALQTAAALIAQATSLSQLLAGAGPEPQPALGHVLTFAALVLAVNAGLHVRAAEIVIRSYDVFPPGRLPDADLVADWGVAQIGRAFALAFSMAAPFAAAALLYNVALGAINRAMPSLMVSFIGAPALAGGGLVMLALLAPTLLALWLNRFLAFLDTPFGPP